MLLLVPAFDPEHAVDIYDIFTRFTYKIVLLAPLI